MPVAVAVTRTDRVQNDLVVDGILTLSGNYGAAGEVGDTVDFSTEAEIISNSVPTRVELFEAPAAGNAPAGYFYCFAPGTTIKNGKLVIMTVASETGLLAEITAGDAYPNALAPREGAQPVHFRAYFPFGI